MNFSISDALQATMTGAVYQVWNQTQGLLAPVVIYKEPVKNIVSNPQNVLYGYSDASTPKEEITYSTVSRTFSGQIVYPQKPMSDNSRNYFDNKVSLDHNSTYLRAQQDVYDYIYNGDKTDKIEADDKTWNYKGKMQIQNFLNLKFYYFEIEATN